MTETQAIQLIWIDTFLLLAITLILLYCTQLFRTMVSVLTQMSINMRVLETVDHRLNVIEIKLERISK